MTAEDRRRVARGTLLLLAGWLLGFADIRIDGVDVVPDPLGLLLWAGGLDAVRRAVAGDRAAVAWAAFAEAVLLTAAVVSVADVARPLSGGLAAVYAGLGALGMVTAAVALSRAVALAGDPRLARLWSVVAVLIGVAGALWLLVTAAPDDGSAAALPAIVVSLLASLWYLALLLRTWQFARR